MSRLRLLLALAGLLWTAAVEAPAAGAQAPLRITADTSERGWIGVRVQAPAGATVYLGERVGTTVTSLATLVSDDGAVEAPRALAWTCDKRRRVLVASARTAEGTALATEQIVKTPTCAGRFTVKLRPRTAPRAGRPVRVSVRDLWGLGTPDGRICLRVTKASRCVDVAVPADGGPGVARVRAARPGRAEVVVEVAGATLRRRMDVRSRRAPLRILATGDSMIQIVDSHLKRRLAGRAGVRSDARISTGISKPSMLNWMALARRQASRRPHVTVVFLGANDGFPIGGRACCGRAWIKGYSARVRRMMASYRRRGSGRVYWLLLPTPRRPTFARVFRAVNAAVRRAAATYDPDEVAVIDLVEIFTPGGRYRSSIRGRTVRQGDGVHLNVTGASIAAGAIIRRLRADGLIG